ncbi:DUF1648 domain-containing protein [Winogradskyella sp. PG-2]|uniref:DUF1648 domain-containing protein n=1 Tax=Winogradskyella sp. PG-2 TaxID=754409 RepID=UPI00045898D4|nr:DUF1648 domain-containing protein [Winogradskyella sp. PG-2]BAO76692.1 conserved domain protein [Winogradskyella sp. PG-2]
MKSDRPKIQVPFQTVDVVIELASIAVLLLMWIHLLMEYSGLPESIAVHFNAAGQPDNYSKKSFLWFLPILATVIYVGLFILNRFPHIHNYMVNITEENALRQYRFSTRILRIINFLCVLLLAYINYKIIIGAQTNTTELGTGFLITVIGGSLLLPIFILVYQQKLKKQDNV